MPYIAVLLVLCCAAAQSASSSQSDPTAKFKASFAHRRPAAGTDQPDPAIQECMAIVAYRIREIEQRAGPEDRFGSALDAFRAAIDCDKRDYRNYGHLDAAYASCWPLDAAVVQMGDVSRIFLWRKGKPVPLPKPCDWFGVVSCSPHITTDGSVVVDGEVFTEIGMRYGFQTAILHPRAGRYPHAEIQRGEWYLEDLESSHFGFQGTIMVTRDLVEPKVLRTSMAEGIFRRTRVYDLLEGNTKLVYTAYDMPRAMLVDQWIYRTLHSKQLDPLQARFIKRFGREMPGPADAGNVEDSLLGPGRARVRFSLGDNYEFTLKKEKSGWRISNFTVNEWTPRK